MKNITTLSVNEFYNCSSLISVINTDNIYSIGNSAFGHCTSLKTITLSDKLLKIPVKLFDSCTSLETVSGLTRFTYIPDNLFDGCINLKEFHNIINTDIITTIGISSFNNCPSLNIGELYLPNCTSIGERCFNSNNGAYSKLSITSINLPVCTIVGDYAFRFNPYITSINIPECITLGGANFSDCTLLKTLNFQKIQTIGGGCFSNINSLDHVDFPDTLKTINGELFHGSKMRYAKFLSIVPPSATDNIFPYTTHNIYVPDNSVDDYKSATYWNNISSRIFSLTQWSTDFPNG